MDNAKSQLVDRLKTANSVLITVSRNPSVDQLAACIGLTLIVNKLGKHGSAVFSGEAPSTIEFLKPEETLEKTADSLRDFIIALDKNKADKLRYKVEDQMVKIFITPYKTSLSEKDLEFSQGDFNVELVIALGVKNQQDLDEAIIAHGRILHDATVACINTNERSDLGTINWQEQTASSLCELVTDLASALGQNLLDQQIATALLTGIIAETDRFSNAKTTSQTMSVSGQLMGAGANQQLVATNLGEQQSKEQADKEASSKSSDGTLSIDHDKQDLDITTLPKPTETNENVSEEQPLTNAENSNSSPPSSQRLVTEPPTLGGTLTANSSPEQYDPSTDPLSNAVIPGANPAADTSHAPTVTVPPSPQSPPSYTPPPPSWTPPPAPNDTQGTNNTTTVNIPPPSEDNGQHKDLTINQLEQAVDSPHIDTPSADEAREKIEAIIKETPSDETKPEQAINAMPLGQPLHQNDSNTPTTGTTDLKSIISELPTKDQAPPVPPPLPINGNDQDKEQQDKQ
ncbi:MAG: DHH family phosphoesterase [Candidatus Saccharimonadales bacterium]